MNFEIKDNNISDKVESISSLKEEIKSSFGELKKETANLKQGIVKNISVSDAEAVLVKATDVFQKSNSWENINKQDNIKFGGFVLALQIVLKSKGFDPGIIDGIYGENTKSAIKAYQEKKQLKVDGFIGRETLNTLITNIKQATDKQATDKQATDKQTTDKQAPAEKEKIFFHRELQPDYLNAPVPNTINPHYNTRINTYNPKKITIESKGIGEVVNILTHGHYLKDKEKVWKEVLAANDPVLHAYILYEAMNGVGTDNEINKVLSSNTVNRNDVYTVFGTIDGQNLVEWLRNDLGESQKDTVFLKLIKYPQMYAAIKQYLNTHVRDSYKFPKLYTHFKNKINVNTGIIV